MTDEQAYAIYNNGEITSAIRSRISAERVLEFGRVLGLSPKARPISQEEYIQFKREESKLMNREIN